MKSILKLVGAVLCGIGVVLSAPAATTNTDGRATFNVTVLRDGGNEAPNHIQAIWVTDEAGRWVKTLRKQAATRIQWLIKWNLARGGVNGITNVDGYTGATTSSYSPITEVWNCRYTNGLIVPDGIYKIYVEFTEWNGQGNWTTNGLAFFKGTTPSTNIYPDLPYIKYMTNTYIPNLNHDIAVTALAPSTGQTNTNITVQVTFTNKTAYIESFTLTLSNLTSSTLLGSQQVTNMAGHTVSNLNFTWSTAGVPLGAYSMQAVASPVDLETNIADNTFTRAITLVPTPHDLAVLSISPVGFTNANTTLKVLVTNATVTTESFWIVASNLTSSSLIASQQVLNLPGSKATNVSITWNTLGMNGGDYLVQATAGPVTDELATSDNTLTSTITLRQGIPNLAILRITAPAQVGPSSTNSISVIVTNCGDFAVLAAASLADETEGRSLGSYPPISLQPGTTLNALFSWKLTNAPYGYHVLRAAVTPVANEIDPADNTNRLMVPIAHGWATNTFIAKGGVWWFHDKGLDLGATPWRQANYYDQVWSNSPAPLGYSAPPSQNTNMNYVMSYGSDGNNKYPTYYLRAPFYADALPTNLTLNVRRDDGVVFYLNGAELARYNMPTGAVAYATYAAANVTGDPQYAYYSTNVSPANIVLGRNVLAAELHQFTNNSADVVLDVEMLGTVPLFPAVHDVDAVAVVSGGDAVAGDRMPVTVTVTNAGNRTEDVLIVLKDLTSGQIAGSQLVKGVGPGTPASVRIDWATLGAASGAHNLQAYTVVNNVTNTAGAFTGSATISGSGFALNAVNAAASLGGRCAALAATSNLLVAGAGATLEIWNRAIPATPVKVGAVRLPGLIEGLAVSGSWAYAACGNAGVQFVNISAPAQPSHQNTFSTSGNAYGVAVSGNYLYVADGAAGLRIVNVSNPGNPSLAGAYYTEGPARAVAVTGSTAYLLDQHLGLVVLNVANPNAPALSGSYAGFDSGQALAIAGSYAYIVDANNHFFVVNVGSPTPSLSSSLIVPNMIGRAVAVNGSTVYLAAGSDGLHIINAASPTAPVLLTTISVPGEALGLALAGSTLYLADGLAGFQIFNVQTPASPALQSDWPTALRAADVVLANNLAYVAGGESGLRIYSVTNPLAPVLLSRFTQAANARCVAVSGSAAYLGDGQYGLKIINVANPAAPALLGSYASADLSSIRNVGAAGSLVVVSDGRKLQLINASTPASPALAGSYDAPSFVFSLAVANSKAYLACGNAGLTILTVTTGSPLTLAGSYDTPGLASGISVSGTTAYVADGNNGWLILDVSNPAAPSLLKANTAQGPVADIAVANTLASLGSGANKVVTMDVSSLLTPVENRSFTPLVRALRLAANGVLVAAAEDEAGLAILSNSTDVDQDGLPDAWEQQIINLSLATNGPIRTIWDVRTNDDFDGDGLSNLAEYIAGTSPVDPNSRFALFVPSAPAGGSITLRWPSVAGRIYAVYYTTNLANGFSLVQGNLAATPGTNTFTASAPAGARFYMIGVQ